MIKKQTGVSYTPQEYRALKHCVACNRVSDIKYGEQCEVCKAKNLRHCKMCEIVLRTGKSTYYTYDIKEEYRGDAVNPKPNRKDVIEFSYERDTLYPPHSPNLCIGCFGFEERIKDVCWVCRVKFENTEENYKANGNTCSDCAEPLLEIELNDEETDNDRLEG